MDVRRAVVTFTAGLAVATAPLALGAAAAGPMGQADFPPPVDPESWVLPEWMTWDDYRPIPGVDWNDPGSQPVRKIRAALILGDFEDRPFVVSQPPGSDLFGLDGVHNPMLEAPVPVEELADWWVRFLVTEPSELNHFHTINEYWLEDSYGLIGVDAVGFGPYVRDLTNVIWKIYFKKMGPQKQERMEPRTIRLLLMLMLARIDGKSPVEYLEENQQEFVRMFVKKNLSAERFFQAEINQKWKGQLRKIFR